MLKVLTISEGNAISEYLEVAAAVVVSKMVERSHIRRFSVYMFQKAENCLRVC